MIAVALHSDDRYRDCINMFDYGFQVVRPVTVADAGETLTNVAVSGGVKDRVGLAAENNLTIRLDPDDLPNLERKVEVEPVAPQKGQRPVSVVYAAR